MMSEVPIDVLGIPAGLLVLAAAVIGAILGLVWLRRMLTIEPDAHSFRATSGSARPWRMPVAIGLAAAAVLLVAAALGVIRLG
jgi:hypothetical protein